MNAILEAQTRKQILEGLKRCTEPQQLLFKRMYSHNNLDATIEEVVTKISTVKLDHAYTQVERTLTL